VALSAAFRPGGVPCPRLYVAGCIRANRTYFRSERNWVDVGLRGRLFSFHDTMVPAARDRLNQPHKTSVQYAIFGKMVPDSFSLLTRHCKMQYHWIRRDHSFGLS
jgi:hypothetical protein